MNFFLRKLVPSLSLFMLLVGFNTSATAAGSVDVKTAAALAAGCTNCSEYKSFILTMLIAQRAMSRATATAANTGDTQAVSDVVKQLLSQTSNKAAVTLAVANLGYQQPQIVEILEGADVPPAEAAILAAESQPDLSDFNNVNVSVNDCVVNANGSATVSCVR